MNFNYHFYAWAWPWPWPRKKNLKSILCVTSVIFRADFRKSSPILKLKQGIALMENGKPNALFHIWEWVCVHERCTSHLPKQSQFIYLPATGVTKSRDSPFSSIGLITSGNLKTFAGFFQGLKSHSGTGTRDSCEHPKRPQVAWRGHHVSQHYPGALWFTCLEKYATPMNFQD